MSNQETEPKKLRFARLVALLIWEFTILILNGISGATFINLITTITKLIPIFLFSIILLFVLIFINLLFNIRI